MRRDWKADGDGVMFTSLGRCGFERSRRPLAAWPRRRMRAVVLCQRDGHVTRQMDFGNPALPWVWMLAINVQQSSYHSGDPAWQV